MRRTSITKTTITKPRYWIGIDTGVNTGYAIWDRIEKKFTNVETGKIHQAMFVIKNKVDEHGIEWFNQNFFVVIEDARKRKFDPGMTDAKRMGAGYVKRDAVVWEDFLTELGVNFKMVAPNGRSNDFAKAKNLKLWQSNCGWTKQTSEHARCAAMLVWGN